MSLTLLMSLLVVGCSSAPDPKDSVAQSEASIGADQSTNEQGSSFCSPVTSTPREALFVGAPTENIEPGIYTFTLDTNCGQIVIDADAQSAPATVTHIGFLANAKFYDATLCHRLTTAGLFVLQCGDPTASGSGGPGFSFGDENLPEATGINYPKGTVAMANSGPNTNGSQFFIVYQDTVLGPNYSIWGKVRDGMEIVEKLGAIGTVDGGPNGAPKYPVEIRTARLS